MTILRSIKRGVINSFRLGVKDLVVFARDRMRLLTFIIMPIFMMIMIGFVFPSQGALKDAPLGIVNLDQGPLGRQIVAILSQPDPQTGDRLFKITNASGETEAVRLIEKQAINGAIVIPADFSTRLSSGGQGVVTVITDQANPQSRENKGKIMIPAVKIFFRPIISASLPKGSKKAAEVSR